MANKNQSSTVQVNAKLVDRLRILAAINKKSIRSMLDEAVGQYLQQYNEELSPLIKLEEIFNRPTEEYTMEMYKIDDKGEKTNDI